MTRPKITPEQEARFHALEQEAVDRLLNDIDFDVRDNLTPDEIVEYDKLRALYFDEEEDAPFDLNPLICPSAPDIHAEPSDENAHKWDDSTDPITCAECGATK